MLSPQLISLQIQVVWSLEPELKEGSRKLIAKHQRAHREMTRWA